MASGSGASKTKVDEDLLPDSGGGYRHEEQHNYSSTIVKICLLFMVLVLIYLVVSQPSYPAQLLERSYSIATSTSKMESTSQTLSRPHIDETTEESLPLSKNDSTVEKSSTPLFHQFKSENPSSPTYNENVILESALRKASMNFNKTVIITTLNAAWTAPNSIFDLFLESFRNGNQTKHLLSHLLVVALDQTAYSRCMEKRLHCYALATEGVDFSGPAFFMSSDYLKMMWRRIDFLRSVLELGYSFVFTDADVMWMRDPFPRFYPDTDFQISCDHYGYNSTNLKNLPNGGYNYVRSNNRTIKFYKFWYNAKDYFPGMHDQDVFNKIKFNPFLWQIKLKIKFLDTAYFGGFCQPSKDLDLVVTMHANCCVGMWNKIHDIKMLKDDWRNYMATPAGERNLSTRSWTYPRICGWVKG